ncbi:hypothetical protein C8J56DRAFT_1064467 [Mycena floridula]|nr:hypothetical protein C8J56DRAFT_1064467 [Mycena floridula]
MSIQGRRRSHALGELCFSIVGLALIFFPRRFFVARPSRLPCHHPSWPLTGVWIFQSLRRSSLFNKDGSTVDRRLDTELAYGSEPMLVLIHLSRRHCLAISRFARSLVTVAFESSITRLPPPSRQDIRPIGETFTESLSHIPKLTVEHWLYLYLDETINLRLSFLGCYCSLRFPFVTAVIFGRAALFPGREHCQR